MRGITPTCAELWKREVNPEDPLAGHLSPNLSVQEGAITWGGNRNTSLPREEALGNGLHNNNNNNNPSLPQPDTSAIESSQRLLPGPSHTAYSPLPTKIIIFTSSPCHAQPPWLPPSESNAFLMAAKLWLPHPCGTTTCTSMPTDLSLELFLRSGCWNKTCSYAHTATSHFTHLQQCTQSHLDHQHFLTLTPFDTSFSDQS